MTSLKAMRLIIGTGQRYSLYGQQPAQMRASTISGEWMLPSSRQNLLLIWTKPFGMLSQLPTRIAILCGGMVAIKVREAYGLKSFLWLHSRMDEAKRAWRNRIEQVKTIRKQQISLRWWRDIILQRGALLIFKTISLFQQWGVLMVLVGEASSQLTITAIGYRPRIMNLATREMLIRLVSLEVGWLIRLR